MKISRDAFVAIFTIQLQDILKYKNLLGGVELRRNNHITCHGIYSRFSTVLEAREECINDELCKGIYGVIPDDDPSVRCNDATNFYLCKELTSDPNIPGQKCNWEKKYGTNEIIIIGRRSIRYIFGYPYYHYQTKCIIDITL